jgi:adenylate kinase family enzyme
MNLRISILGGPHSGKTKQAKMLANRYNLVYLNAEDILLGLDGAPDQAELKDSRPSYNSVTCFF